MIDIKSYFETAIMVDKVMPSDKPKFKTILNNWQSDFITTENGERIVVTKDDIKIYDIVCFEWVKLFEARDRWLFNLLWEFYARKSRKKIAKKYSCSVRSLYNYVNDGKKIIKDSIL